MAAFNYNILHQVTDGFHEGEYLGTYWAIRPYLDGTAAFPLLVHGPMDFIPALVAELIAGDRSLIVLTRAINSLAAAITWVLFLDMLLTLLRRHEYRFAAGFVSGLTFLGMIVVIPADAVERQQAFLAIRDLFLVTALWGTLNGILAGSQVRRSLLLLLAGAAAAASLYWAYDRFLASIAFGGGVAVILLVQRAWLPAATAVLGAVAGLLVIPQLLPTGSMAENAANLAYWIQFSGEVWRLSYLARVPSVPTALAMIALLALAARAWREERTRHPGDLVLAFSAGLVTLQLFFLFKYFNLPRQPNNYYFVWPFVLLLAALPYHSPLSRRIDDAVRGIWTAAKEGGIRRGLGLGVMALSLLVITANNMAFSSAMNLRALFRLPADADLIPPAIVEASRNPALPRTGCVLLWSNEGIFATAMRRPICTQYVYPVYASADREADLLQQIVDASPAVVVFDSPFWSMNIYGRTMQQRLPAVDRYLRENYDFAVSNGYTLGIRRLK